MSRQDWTTFRKISVVCLLFAMLVVFWASRNASAQGPANGVVQRITTLEAAVADLQTAVGDGLDRIDALEGDVTTLEGEVADLETRVAALEAAATP